MSSETEKQKLDVDVFDIALGVAGGYLLINAFNYAFAPEKEFTPPIYINDQRSDTCFAEFNDNSTAIDCTEKVTKMANKYGRVITPSGQVFDYTK